MTTALGGVRRRRLLDRTAYCPAAHETAHRFSVRVRHSGERDVVARDEAPRPQQQGGRVPPEKGAGGQAAVESPDHADRRPAYGGKSIFWSCSRWEVLSAR